MKEKLVIHKITIKLKTRKKFYTNTIHDRIVKLLRSDKFFTEDNFESILTNLENNLE